MPDLEELQARLARYMQEHGLKHTRQRQLIFEAFLGAGEHVAVDELLEQVQVRMPSVGYATVYRTLKMFTEAGVAHERRFGDGQARYEPQSDEEDHDHDHLICDDCGHIFEFEDPLIESRQRDVAARHGLEITAHRHVIMGKCTRGERCEFRKLRVT
jgi:Fur family transcriptional regulator, ferric uptake regulator